MPNSTTNSDVPNRRSIRLISTSRPTVSLRVFTFDRLENRRLLHGLPVALLRFCYGQVDAQWSLEVEDTSESPTLPVWQVGANRLDGGLLKVVARAGTFPRLLGRPVLPRGLCLAFVPLESAPPILWGRAIVTGRRPGCYLGSVLAASPPDATPGRVLEGLDKGSWASLSVRIISQIASRCGSGRLRSSMYFSDAIRP